MLCGLCHRTVGYRQGVRNLARLSLKTDNSFCGGVGLQMATVTADVEIVCTVRLTVGILV